MAFISSQHQKICSIEISADGIALVCASNLANPEIELCAFYPCQSQDNEHLKQCLVDVVLKNNLKKASCCWILHPDQYHLTLVDIASNIPQIEYKKAVRWQIKDLADYPVEDDVIEIFCSGKLEDHPKKLFVVVAKNSFLQNIVAIIQECFLKPRVIDIREFSIRNLITRLSIENESIGFFDVNEESCLLSIVQKKYIKFVRRIPFGLNKQNNLIAELQHSFDYCASEFNQEIPKKFFVPPLPDTSFNITQEIAKSLNKDVNILSLQSISSFITTADIRTQERCWAAIGGVLYR